MKNDVPLSVCLLCAVFGAARLWAIEEKTFSQEFSSRVRPWCEASRRTGELRAPDGLTLRWYSIEVPHEKAALVVLPGWTEVGEAFTEVLYDLRDLGLSFYVLDHRGQGLSDGEIEPRDRWDIADWGSMLSDLELFMDTVVSAKPHPRVILYGNSMGGALASIYQARHAQRAQALVLTVPLFKPNTAPFPVFAVSALARLFVAFGKGGAYLPGYGPYQRHPFEGNPWAVTSPGRYAMLDELNESRTEYQIGGASARGGREILRLSREARAAASRVTAPVLLVQAGRDVVVRNDAQDRAAAAMAGCRLVRVGDAGHLVMYEKDEVRKKALAAIREFIEEHTR